MRCHAISFVKPSGRARRRICCFGFVGDREHAVAAAIVCADVLEAVAESGSSDVGYFHTSREWPVREDASIRCTLIVTKSM